MSKAYEMMRHAGILVICIFKYDLVLSTFVHMMCHSSNSSLYFASIYRHTPDYITKFASESMGDGVLALSDKKGTVFSIQGGQISTGKTIR